MPFQTTVTGTSGNLGTLVLAANGSYTYTVANAATQSLGLGDTSRRHLHDHGVDGTTKQVSFTINGTNDGAVIGNPTVSAVTEDSGGERLWQPRCLGTIPISDPDAGENPSKRRLRELPATSARLVLAANGSYTYTVANAATQSLGHGGTSMHVDTFTVTAADGTTNR